MIARASTTMFGVAVFLVARAGFAEPESTPAKPEVPKHHQQGFEPSIYVGVGGYANQLRFAGERWASGELEPSVGLHADLAYRVIPALDLGLHVFHQWIATENAGAGVSARATAPGAGILGRVHPLAIVAPRLPIDVTLGTGFDFSAAARQRREATAGGVTIESHSAVTGFAVPFWLSFDVFVARTIALGLVGIWSPWFRVEECRHEGASGLSAQCQREPVSSDKYLFFGVGARFHLDFVH